MKIALERAEFHVFVKRYSMPQIFEHTDLLKVLEKDFSDNLGTPNTNTNWNFNCEYFLEQEPMFTSLEVVNPTTLEVIDSFEVQHNCTNHMSNEEIYAKVITSILLNEKAN
jgi:hypothetical protein